MKKLTTSIVRSLDPNKKEPITFGQLFGAPDHLPLNNAAALVEKFAQSDGSDLKQAIEDKQAFNQEHGIEM